MLNITELENRQKKYKIRSYLPRAIIAIAVGVIGTTFIAFSPAQTIPSTKAQIITKDVVINSTKPTIALASKKQTKQEYNIVKPITKRLQNISDKNNIPSTKQLVLSPSLKFMKNIQYVEKKLESSEEIIEEKFSLENSNEVKQVIEVIEPEIKEDEITIHRQNTNKDIEHVLKRFENNNNPALSLFVAKKYYELGLYDKSYNYSLITNDINSEIDDSWIIFTKSLVKLNKKNKAIKILREYIKNSHSSEAKILLDEILSGKFNES